MTKMDMAKSIVSQRGLCNGIRCDDCPIGPPTACGNKIKGLLLAQEWIENHKEAKSMDKPEAMKRLDAIEKEAGELRKIIEREDKIEYNGGNLFVWIDKDGEPFVLCGSLESDYYRWHSLQNTTRGWASNHKTGQDAIDYISRGKITAFDNPTDGVKFFYDAYIKYHGGR